MRVQFVARENGPERLVSEAEIVFEEVCFRDAARGLLPVEEPGR